jgi:voltage-dependent calcium channel
VECSTPNIINACKDTRDSDYSWPSKVAEGIDLNKLAKVLNSIDYTAIRRRRNLYSRLYHEASISHQHGRGISFTDMLMMLAHHKLIVDREALVYVLSLTPMLTRLSKPLG